MFTRHALWALVCAVALVESGSGQTVAPTRDARGDPLPDGAVARIGSARLRHVHTVTSLAFSSDGKMLISSGYDHAHSIRLWDASTGREVRKFIGHSDLVHKVVIAADGAVVASASSDKTVRIWDVATGKELGRLDHKDAVNSVAISTDGKQLASGGKEKILRIWDLPARKLLREIKAHDDAISAVEFSSDGDIVATAAAGNFKHVDWSIRLWDPRSLKRLKTLPGHEPAVVRLALAADGRTVASAGFDGCIRLWDAQQGKEISKIDLPKSGHGTMAFSPDGKRLAASTRSGVRIWDAASQKELLTIVDGGSGLAWSPDGAKLAIGGGFGLIRLWDSKTGNELLPVHPPQPKSLDHSILGVAFSPDGTAVATAGPGDAWGLWRRATGKPIREGKCKNGPAVQVRFSPDGKLLAIAQTGGVQLWDAASGEDKGWIPCGERHVTFAFALDGKALASGDDTRVVRLTSLDTGQEVWRSAAYKYNVTAVAFAPGGEVVASASNDGSVRFLDVANGRAISQFQGGRFQVAGLAFAPQGGTLAVTAVQVVNNYGGTALTVYDLATGKERWSTTPYVGQPRSVAYSPDGLTIAVGSDDDQVHLYDVRSGKQVRVLHGYDGYACCVAFSDDGRWLASGNRGGTTLVWDMKALGRFRAPESTTELTKVELEAAWAQLAKADGRGLHQALWKLAGGKDNSIAFLREQRGKGVLADPPVDAKTIELLLNKLDHAFAAVRAEGIKELNTLGPAADPALRQALKGKLADEARAAIEKLLESRERGLLVPPGETLRWVRVVEILEIVGTPAARDFLQTLAKDQPQSYEARLARAALKRLQARNVEKS